MHGPKEFQISEIFGSAIGPFGIWREVHGPGPADNKTETLIIQQFFGPFGVASYVPSSATNISNEIAGRAQISCTGFAFFSEFPFAATRTQSHTQHTQSIFGEI
jgi:hypothetical protein